MLFHVSAHMYLGCGEREEEKEKGEREGRSLIVESASTHIPILDRASGCSVYSYYMPGSGKGNKNRPLQSASNKVSTLCSPVPFSPLPGKGCLTYSFYYLYLAYWPLMASQLQIAPSR